MTSSSARGGSYRWGTARWGFGGSAWFRRATAASEAARYVSTGPIRFSAASKTHVLGRSDKSGTGGSAAAEQRLALQRRWTERVSAAATAALASLVLSVLAALSETVGSSAVGGLLDWARDVEVDFYRQASQIIPVLLLAVAIERRVFDLGGESVGHRSGRRLVFGAALIAVVAAELLSLYAVAVNAAEPFYFPVTAGVVIALLVLVVVVALGALPARESG